MILIFALAAALCLQIFVKADNISQTTYQKDKAVVLAQNAAELLKATAGNFEAVQTMAEEPYRIAITAQPNQLPGLQQVHIQVYYETELLFAVNTGWQEAGE